VAKEHQRLYVRGKDVGAVVNIVKGEQFVVSLGPMFDEAKKVYIDVPVGDRVDLAGVDEKEDAVFLKISSVDKPPAVCIVEDGRKWCNYDVFRSGKDAQKIRRWFEKISDAVRLLEDVSPAARETLNHLVVSLNVREGIPSEKWGYSVSAYTDYSGEAPVCEVTLDAKWLDEGSPLLVARMLSHELGHCQEAYHRRIRYMGPRYGEWKKREGDVVPVGEERAAENFSLRVTKRAMAKHRK